MNMNKDIINISHYFLESADDKDELQKLISVINNRKRWVKSHAYFSEVRQKNLKAIKNKHLKLECLYGFIEICYKALFNLTNSIAPFDSDSPYYIIPIALHYCDVAKLDRQRIIDIITS